MQPPGANIRGESETGLKVKQSEGLNLNVKAKVKLNQNTIQKLKLKPPTEKQMKLPNRRNRNTKLDPNQRSVKDMLSFWKKQEGNKSETEETEATVTNNLPCLTVRTVKNIVLDQNIVPVENIVVVEETETEKQEHRQETATETETAENEEKQKLKLKIAEIRKKFTNRDTPRKQKPSLYCIYLTRNRN